MLCISKVSIYTSTSLSGVIMLFNKSTTTLPLTAVLLTLLFLSPASGITSNFGAESSTGAVNIAGKFSLAEAGSLTDQVSLGQGIASRNLLATGQGQSSVTDSISGRDSSGQSFSISKTACVDGELQTSSSAAATPAGGLLSQETDLSGDGGLFAIKSASPENKIAAAAVFSDDGFLSSTMSGAAQGRSALGGDAQVMGVSCFDQQKASILSSGDLGMSVSGLYLSGDGLQKFGLAAINEERSGRTSDTDSEIISGVYGYYDDPNAYVISGYRWPVDPKLQIYLKESSVPANLKTTAASTIATSANIWDSAAKENLFLDTGFVTTTTSGEALDYKNVHLWKYDTSDALGYSTTYYTRLKTLKVGTTLWKKAVDSDVVYNTRYGWTTIDGAAYLIRDKDGKVIPESSVLDLQTVATHELGHTLGLGDTYLHKLYKYDLAQIMGFYDAPQRSLGAGDTSGIRKIYGVP
ncbi:MAG: hypothetical protein A4E45_00876 [Methanosaeta sp. PtaB.Bin039]|nr:MAG: hypothetical protein A4E45_00876 [Methanosaeta sp. PtaB.Bin039]